MAISKKRKLVKEALRLHCSFEGPSLEEAATQVGLGGGSLRYFRSGDRWQGLCQEVAEDSLVLALPIAIRRLVDAARLDKSSSGVTAAKTLVDLCRGEDTTTLEAQDSASDGIDLEELTKEEREIACRLLARLDRPRSAG